VVLSCAQNHGRKTSYCFRLHSWAYLGSYGFNYTCIPQSKCIIAVKPKNYLKTPSYRSHPSEAGFGRADRANKTSESTTCTDLTSSQRTQHHGPSPANSLRSCVETGMDEMTTYTRTAYNIAMTISICFVPYTLFIYLFFTNAQYYYLFVL